MSAVTKAAVSSVTPSPLAPYQRMLRYDEFDVRDASSVSYHVVQASPTRTAGRGGAPAAWADATSASAARTRI